MTAEPNGRGGLTEILTRPEIGLGGEILVRPPVGDDLEILRRPPIGSGGELGPGSGIKCSCDILTRPPEIGQGPIIEIPDPILQQILGQPKINIKPPPDPWEERLKPGIIADPIYPDLYRGKVVTWGNNFQVNPLITNNFQPATPTFKTIYQPSIYGSGVTISGSGGLNSSSLITSDANSFSLSGFISALLSFF